MIRWHHQLDGHEFEQTPDDGEGQRSLVCCSSWGHKESDTTQQLNQQQRSRSRPKAVSQKGSYLQRMIQLCSKILITACAVIYPQGPAEGLLQLCLTLSNPMDCSPPGASVHRILQARRLEWVAMPSFRGSSQPKDQNLLRLLHCQEGSLPPVPLGKPMCL